MKRLFPLLFSIILLNSCKSEPPISEKKFIEVYSKMIIMQDTSSIGSKAIKDSVLAEYGITESDYEKTIEFYNNEPERWQKFFVKAESYLDSLKKSSISEKP